MVLWVTTVDVRGTQVSGSGTGVLHPVGNFRRIHDSSSLGEELLTPGCPTGGLECSLPRGRCLPSGKGGAAFPREKAACTASLRARSSSLLRAPRFSERHRRHSEKGWGGKVG